MLLPVVFPTCITYGSTFSETWDVNTVVTASRIEWRDTQMDRPLGRYSLNAENMNAEDYSQLIKLWHVTQGALHDFLFLNPYDNTSAARDIVNGTVITSTDQFVDTAVGNKDEYTLFKTYEVGGYTFPRKIHRIVDGTLKVSVDGFDMSNVIFKNSSAKLAFIQSIAPFTFYGSFVGNRVTGADFSELKINELVQISTSEGFTGTRNPYRVIEAGSKHLIVSNYDGSPIYLDYTGDLLIRSVLPPTGARIFAGFQYYTPVSFNLEAMTVEAVSGLNETSFTNVQSIELKEVIPYQ